MVELRPDVRVRTQLKLSLDLRLTQYFKPHDHLSSLAFVAKTTGIAKHSSEQQKTETYAQEIVSLKKMIALPKFCDTYAQARQELLMLLNTLVPLSDDGLIGISHCYYSCFKDHISDESEIYTPCPTHPFSGSSSYLLGFAKTKTIPSINDVVSLYPSQKISEIEKGFGITIDKTKFFIDDSYKCVICSYATITDAVNAAEQFKLAN